MENWAIAQQIFFWNYVILAGIFVLMIYKSLTVVPIPEVKNERTDYSYNTSRFFYLLLAIPLILWAGFRPDVEDTFSYRDGFLYYDASWATMKDIWLNYEGKSKTYELFQVFIKLFIKDNDILYFTIVSAIIVGLILAVYRRVSCMFPLTVLLFFISCDYYQWTFNGMRQGIAVAFVFFASFLLLDKKYVWAIIFTIIAALFHSSAIIFLIAFYFSRKKPWSKSIMLFLTGVILVLFSLSSFTGILDNMLQDTNYSNVVSQFANDNGVSVLRVLVYSVPCIIAFCFKKQIEEFQDPTVDFAINMSTIGVAFYILGMFTSGIYIGRIPIYFTLWNYVILAWELKFLFGTRSMRLLVEIIMLLFYAYYNYYQMSIFMSWYW